MQKILSRYVDALRPILYIETDDFHTIDNEIGAWAAHNGVTIHEYSNALGEVDFETKRASFTPQPLADFLVSYYDAGMSNDDDEDEDNPAEPRPILLLLKDIHPHIDTAHGASPAEAQRAIAMLRHIAERRMYSYGFDTTVCIVSAVRCIPRELEHLVTLVPVNRPSEEDIVAVLQSYADAQGYEHEPADMNELALDLKGLTRLQVKQILDLACCDDGYISREKDGRLINSEKKQIIDKSGLLEFVETTSSMDDIGGTAGLKTWLKNKAHIFRNLSAALSSGVSMPKGVLILGVPGCGKSLTAKVTANTFNVPLLRLDLGRILGKYVGESEHNMRRALALAEGISPCVLWIDEIEKAFAGGMDSHDVTVRLMGQFLTWVQEKDSTVFVVATANDISKLPVEFFRKGRFDEIFYVGLPDDKDKREILEIHLRKSWRKPGKPDLSQLDLQGCAKKAKKFSGADIGALVSAAMEIAFARKCRNRDDAAFVTKEDMDKAFDMVSASLTGEVEKIEDFCKEKHFRFARDPFPVVFEQEAE